MLSIPQIQQYGANAQRTFFRFKYFPEKKQYLLTNDIGRYIYLSQKDFFDFVSHAHVDIPEKQKELEEKLFLKTESYEALFTTNFVKKNSFIGIGPSLHILVTTLRCNHACEYCHASVVGDSDTSYDMSLDTAKKVVDTIFFSNSHTLTIEFQGGESLLNFPLIQFVVRYAKERAMHLGKTVSFALVSNLTLLDEEKLDFFIEHEVDISTSLDGDEELHNFNRTYRKGNSYQEVTQKLQYVQQRYQKQGIQKKVGALLTTTRFSLEKSKEIVDTYLSQGLEGIYIRPLNPYGFAEKKLAQIGYTSQEFIEFYTKTLDYILEINKKGTFFKEQYASIFLQKILTDSDPNFLDSRSPCGACIGQVAYNYDGKIYSCDEGRMFSRMGDASFQIAEVGHNPQETYCAMINNDVTKVMVQSSTLDGLPGYNEHVYKPYLGVCPISAYKATGNIYSNFSKDTRTTIDIAILDIIFERLQDPEINNIFHSWIGRKIATDIFTCS